MEGTLPAETPQRLDVFELRGQHVILDSDLARLFAVESKRLNEQVKRNPEKFENFAFQMTAAEFESLRSHFATSTRAEAAGATAPTSSPSTAWSWPRPW